MIFSKRIHLFLVLPLSSEYLELLAPSSHDYHALFLNNPLYLSLIKAGPYFFLAKELPVLCLIDAVLHKYIPHVLSLLKKISLSVTPETLSVITLENYSHVTLNEAYSTVLYDDMNVNSPPEGFISPLLSKFDYTKKFN